MMARSVVEVPINHVHQLWPQIEGYLAESVKHSNGDLSLEETKVHVTNGTWALIIAIDDEHKVHGAATISYYNRTNDRVAYVTNIGGRFLADRALFSQFCDILKRNGATCIEGTVRDSLMRLWARLGAQKKAISIKIPL